MSGNEASHNQDGERREHYTAYPSGTLIISESGPAMPRNQFEVEFHGRVQSLEDSRKFWRWVAGLGIPAVLSAMFVMLLYGADKISASAERVGEQRVEIRQLQEQVRDLWLKLNKLAGVDPKAVTIVQAP